MSIEALAMAGMDYAKSGIDFRELEYSAWKQPPPYLVADRSSGTDAIGDIMLLANDDQIKSRMRKWARAVVSMNESFLAENGYHLTRKDPRNPVETSEPSIRVDLRVSCVCPY
ncbi:hypothetical protein DVH24_039275 [Malus domestica]|uniref:Uncharacterized protein n=1 Tax=Malus domestica TaxID=3750 RepID=A0A498HVV2_MALDO|nr:hypothetical protein DVH24_039275 [Malus domestica]